MVAIVQEDVHTQGPGDGTVTYTFPSAAAVGNSILGLVRWRTDAQATAITSVTITDESNASVALTRAPMHATGLNAACHAWFYLDDITTASTKTITVTLNGGTVTTTMLSVWELSDADTADMIGGTLSTEGDSSEISGNLTTEVNGSAIFAAYENNAGNQTVQSGWTDIAVTNLSWYSDAAYNLDMGTAGSKTIDPASTNTPADWALTAVEVRPAAGGATITGSGTPKAQDAEVVGTGERDITGSSVVAADDSTIAGTGERTITGSGAPKAQDATVSATGERTITGTAVIQSAASAVVGSGLAIHDIDVVLSIANSTELRDQNEAVLASVSNIAWEWYDTPGSTAGDPVDSGTFNTNANGEATITVNGSTLANGAFGQLILYHPTDNEIRGTFRLPATIP